MSFGFYNNKRPQLVDMSILKKYSGRSISKPQLSNPVIKYIKEECSYILEHFKGLITILILIILFLYYRYKIIQNDKNKIVKTTENYSITYNDNNKYVNGNLVDKNTEILSNDNKLVPPHMRDTVEKIINQDSRYKPSLRPMQLNRNSFYTPL